MAMDEIIKASTLARQYMSGVTAELHMQVITDRVYGLKVKSGDVEELV